MLDKFRISQSYLLLAEHVDEWDAARNQRELASRQEVFDALDVLDQNWQRILAARQNVIVSGVMFTTLPRKISIVSISSARASGSS